MPNRSPKPFHPPRPETLRLRIAARAIALLVRALGATWRVRTHGVNPLLGGDPVIGATWHRGLLASAYVFRDQGLVLPVSLSKDGDLGTAVALRLGFGAPARGSTSRGGVAMLRDLMRRSRAGDRVVVLPDGPRGPARVVQPGVLAVGRASGHPLYPVGISATPARRLPSWDEGLLPLPFARVEVFFGEPLRVPPRADVHELATTLAQLQTALDAITEAADRACGRPRQNEGPAAADGSREGGS